MVPKLSRKLLKIPKKSIVKLKRNVLKSASTDPPIDSNNKDFPRVIQKRKRQKILEIFDEAGDFRKHCHIQLSDLKIGSTALAVITSITNTHIHVDLPYHLFAVISLDHCYETSRHDWDLASITTYYTVGQIVHVAILSIEHDVITATMRPSIINKSLTLDDLVEGMQLPCLLTDVEDFGYVGYIGIDNVGANIFDPSDEFKTPVRSITSVQILKVVRDPDYVTCSIGSHDYIPLNRELNISKIVAGFMVEAQFIHFLGSSSATSHGATLNICQQLPCVMPRSHFPEVHLKFDESLKFRESQKVDVNHKLKARVIFCSPSKIVLSCRWYILNWKPVPQVPLRLGEILKNVKVEYIDETEIAHLSCKYYSINMELDLFKHHCVDKRLSNLHVGDIIESCRVLTVNWLEFGGTVASNKQNLELPYISINELKIGQLVTGKIKKVTEKFLIVQLNTYLQGLLPRNFLTDVPLTYIPKQFSVGSEIKCRIWNVIHSTSTIILIAKKLFLQEVHVKHSIEHFDLDKSYWGVVTYKTKNNLKVSFFGKLSVDIPLNSQDENNYNVGSNIKCRILSINYIVPSLFATLSATAKTTLCLDAATMSMAQCILKFIRKYPILQIKQLKKSINKLKQDLPLIDELNDELKTSIDLNFLNSISERWCEFCIECEDYTKHLQSGMLCYLVVPIWKSTQGILGIFYANKISKHCETDYFRNFYASPTYFHTESDTKKKRFEKNKPIHDNISEELENQIISCDDPYEVLQFLYRPLKQLFMGFVPNEFYSHSKQSSRFVLLTPFSIPYNKKDYIRNVPVLSNNPEILHMKDSKNFLTLSEDLWVNHINKIQMSYVQPYTTPNTKNLIISLGDWNYRGSLSTSHLDPDSSLPTVASRINVKIFREFKHNLPISHPLKFAADARDVEHKDNKCYGSLYFTSKDLYKAYKLLKEYIEDVMESGTYTKITPEIGRIYLGIVLGSNKHGLFILIDKKLKVRVLFSELPEAPLHPDLVSCLYPPFSRVPSVRVTDIQQSNPTRIEGSLKPEDNF